MSKDSLGDRMKAYESTGTSQRLMPLLPVMIRLDGVAFHTFTKGLKRPYDERLSRLMIDTTRYLVQLTNARIGYTQSDEISLVLLADSYESQIFFDSKIYKIASVLPSRCSVYFNKLLASYIPEKRSAEPVFDARIWNVPNKGEAANTLLWREQDATRNSVSMAAQALYSHRELQGKSCNEMQEMIFQKGINWNDYPAFFKRGTYIRRVESERAFTVDELSKLPAKHAARTNPNLTVKRTDYIEIDFGLPLSKIANRTDVLFSGANPVQGESL